VFASDDAHGCAWTCTPCNPLNFQGGSLAKVSQTAGAADTREPGTLAPGRPLAPSAYPRRPRLRGGGGGVRVPRGGGGMGPRPRPAARPAAVGFRVGGGGQGWPRLLPPPPPGWPRGIRALAFVGVVPAPPQGCPRRPSLRMAAAGSGSPWRPGPRGRAFARGNIVGPGRISRPGRSYHRDNVSPQTCISPPSRRLKQYNPTPPLLLLSFADEASSESRGSAGNRARQGSP